jgi:hypothetical protein
MKLPALSPSHTSSERVIDMGSFRNVELISVKFAVVMFWSRGSYEQDWSAKFCSYESVIHAIGRGILVTGIPASCLRGP